MRNHEAAWSEAMALGLGGDARAYRTLLTGICDILQPALRRRFGAMGLGPDDADDVLQEILVAVHAKRGTWDPDRPFMPWLNAIVSYKMTDAMRRARRNRRVFVDAPSEDWSEIVPAPASPDPIAARDIDRRLAQLSDRQRGVVEGLAFEGLSVRLLARRLALTENAVHAAWHRALARLALPAAPTAAQTRPRR